MEREGVLMTTVRDGEIEVMEEKLGQLESELTSYMDQLAEALQDNESLKAELQRIRLAYPDVV